MTISDPTGMEIIQKGGKYFQAMLNPFVGQGKKDKMFNEFIGSLSSIAFQQFAFDWIGSKLKISQGEQFHNSEEQVDAYIKKFPRMGEYKYLLMEKARAYREKKGLAV